MLQHLFVLLFLYPHDDHDHVSILRKRLGDFLSWTIVPTFHVPWAGNSPERTFRSKSELLQHTRRIIIQYDRYALACHNEYERHIPYLEHLVPGLDFMHAPL
jgi:hypothetical protein